MYVMKPLVLIYGQIGPKCGRINLLLGMWVHRMKTTVLYVTEVIMYVCVEEMKFF